MLNDKFIAAAFFLPLLITYWLWLFFNKKRLKPSSFPASWRHILNEKVAFYGQLTAAEMLRFEESALLFLGKIRITGIDTDVDDTDKLLVAASTVIPLFGFPGWYYRNLHEVLPASANLLR